MTKTNSTTGTKTNLAKAEKTTTVLCFVENPTEISADQSAGVAAKAPSKIQIFPKGPNLKTIDGRKFKLTKPHLLAEKLNKASREIVIDYDHKSHYDVDDGGSQIAAGWMSNFEVIDNSLWASVKWTKSAAAKIEDLEYRYFSPEFSASSKTGEVVDISAAGLVNRPAFELVALAKAQTLKKSPTPEIQKIEEAPMLKQIAKSLGLSEDADEKTILAALEKKNADHKTELASVISKAKTPSVDDFMPRKDYDAVLARASTAEKKLSDSEAASFENDVEVFIAQAIKSKKITPASKGHYTALCTDRDQLKKVGDAIGSAPPVASGSGITGKADEQSNPLTDEEINMCSSMGVSEKELATYKKARAAE